MLFRKIFYPLELCDTLNRDVSAGRKKNLKICERSEHAERLREAYTGVQGAAPPAGVQGAAPLAGVQGAAPPGENLRC